MFPEGHTGIVTLSGANSVQQALSYTVDPRNDREIVMRGKFRFFPALNVVGAPPYSIGPGLLAHREACISLIDPAGNAGEQEFKFMGETCARWWEWVEYRAYLPAGLAGLQVRFWAPEAMEFCEGSVRLLD
jgi:hypothetical protein